MTTDKRRKARIRARMARTGERYTTARRHVVGADISAPTVLGYRLRGGVHPDSAAIANVLAHAGVLGPHGTPLSEAVVFGVMGGLGAGYILWEFARDDSRVVTLGFRNQWQYHDRGVRAGLDRLGLAYDHRTTAGTKTAARHLDQVLDAGRPAIVWPDRGVLGYWQLPPALVGHGGHPVVVVGRDGDRVHLDDRTSAALTVDRDVLDRARDRVGSYHNALIDVRADAGTVATADLRAAVVAGIDDCLRQLLGASTSFALPAWRRWGRLMTDSANAKGWPRVFADRVGLCGALLSVWEATSPLGMTGGHLRDLYADFLDEVAPLLGTDVDGVTARLRAAAGQWAALGSAASGATSQGDDPAGDDPAGDDPAGDAPVGHDELDEVRDLIVTIRHCVAADGDEGAAEAAAAGAELWKQREALDAVCPLTSADVEQRFAGMGAMLQGIHELETQALRELAAVRERIA